ncbi:MAG: DUF4136 domain-containing protein [Nitrospinae bacterium]|nr:DUF4136 domain-containing protein [Nitrospinota bacterium]
MRLNILPSFLFLTMLMACASGRVNYDYDPDANFASLKTFDWMQAPEKAGVNRLVVQRVKNAVNAELKAKGLMMTSNNPDFLIAQHLGKKDRVQISDYGYGYAGHRGYRGGYRGGISAYTFEEGSLILDFVDAKSKQLIWRGSAKAQVDNIDTPEKSEKLINAAVKEILKKYPPSSSK